MEELVYLLSEELRYISHKMEDDSIVMYVEPARKQARCPYCSTESGKAHSRYERKLQDLPIQGRKVTIYLTNRKYFCMNEDCDHRTFTEQFSFYEPKATKTKRLQDEIKRISMTQSAVSASKYLRGSVADVGKSTICALLKKAGTIPDRAEVTMVCIDDFALKKRQRYGTVMVDLQTRKIIDMLESREMEDVAQWLAGFPNLCTVSRDGSPIYAAAIAQAHPKAVQISDRFHLIKNLTDRATQALQKQFQGRIAIPITDETQRRQAVRMAGTVRQQVMLVKDLRKKGHTQAEIILITGASARTVKKYIDMPEDEIPEEKTTVRGREHEEAVEKLRECAGRVRALREEGLSLVEICQKTGFTRNMIRNYLSEHFNPVNAHYGKQREGKLEPFRDDVLRWKAQGLTYREIHARIQAKGYGGTPDAIRGFVSKERRIQRDLQSQHGDMPVELIDKKWLIRLLYKPIDKVKGISPAQLTLIFATYPLVERILNTVNQFKSLLKSKNHKGLQQWVEAAAALQIPEFDIFINGLGQDLDAVKQAFTSPFSNGLAEGSVNKIKLVKRIMYGRCHFPLLKSKCLLLNNVRFQLTSKRTVK